MDEASFDLNSWASVIFEQTHDVMLFFHQWVTLLFIFTNEKIHIKKNLFFFLDFKFVRDQ